MDSNKSLTEYLRTRNEYDKRVSKRLETLTFLSKRAHHTAEETSYNLEDALEQIQELDSQVSENADFHMYQLGRGRAVSFLLSVIAFIMSKEELNRYEVILKVMAGEKDLEDSMKNVEGPDRDEETIEYAKEYRRGYREVTGEIQSAIEYAKGKLSEK